MSKPPIGHKVNALAWESALEPFTQSNPSPSLLIRPYPLTVFNDTHVIEKLTIWCIIYIKSQNVMLWSKCHKK